MVGVLESSSPCAWSSFMRDASIVRVGLTLVFSFLSLFSGNLSLVYPEFVFLPGSLVRGYARTALSAHTATPQNATHKDIL